MSWDVSLVSSFNHWAAASPWLTGVAVFFARWLIFAFVLLGIVLVSTGRNIDRHAVAEAVWSVLLTLTITAILAKIIGRARPFLLSADEFLPGHIWIPVFRLIPPPHNFSFPSGHTGTAVAMACAIYRAHRPLGLLAFFMALLIAVGRVAVGVHYPTDIVGGAAVGCVSFCIVRFCHRELRRNDLSKSVKSHTHV